MVVPFLWRTNKQRYSLQGEVCSACSRAMFPPRAICPHCGQPTQPQGSPKTALVLPALLPPQTAVGATMQIAAAGDD